MGNKNDPVSGGSISPPAGDIEPPLHRTWVQNGPQIALGKRELQQFLEYQEVEYPSEVGLWVPHGFDTIITVRDIIFWEDLRHNFLRPPQVFGPALVHIRF